MIYTMEKESPAFRRGMNLPPPKAAIACNAKALLSIFAALIALGYGSVARVRGLVFRDV